jgi:hypothetical protein
LGLGLTPASGVDVKCVRGPIRRLKQLLGAILCVDSIKSQNSQTLIGCSSGPSVIGGYSRLVIAVIAKQNVSICTFMTGVSRNQSSSTQETHRAGNHPHGWTIRGMSTPRLLARSHRAVSSTWNWEGSPETPPTCREYPDI